MLALSKSIFFVFGTKTRLLARFCKCFRNVSKSVFGEGAGLSRAFIGGSGAEIFYLEPEPKKNIWSRSRGKMARVRNTGYQYHFILTFSSAGSAGSQEYSCTDTHHIFSSNVLSRYGIRCGKHSFSCCYSLPVP